MGFVVYLLHKEFAMTDFDKIKQFFVEHTNKYVNYKVVESNELKAQRFPDEYTVCNIFNNKQVVDFFAIEFPYQSNPPLIDVESLDSFTFGIYFVNYGNQIVIDDTRRTWDCGADSFEGNGVIAIQLPLVKHFVAGRGLEMQDYAITKTTSLDSFVADTINMIATMQTLNNLQPTQPYLVADSRIDEARQALTACWVHNKTIH